MKHLVHAILARTDATGKTFDCGIGEARVEFVAEGRLAAVFSSRTQPPTKPRVADLLAHARVVDRLFRHATVIPLRYGCWLDSTQQLGRILRRNQAALQVCLNEIQDCFEMGVRVLPSGSGLRITPMPSGNPPSPASSDETASSQSEDRPDSPGTSYLRFRQQKYSGRDQERLLRDRLLRPLQNAFAGLYRQHLAEPCPSGRAAGWSICFLVPRENAPRFRHVFQEFERTSPHKLLLTGPWPPYTFVVRATSKLI